MDTLNIDKKFQKFRDSLIKDTYRLVIANGGKIELQGATVCLEFSSPLNYNNVLGEVEAVSLTASPEQFGVVTFKYITPQWCENNSDYIDEGSEREEHEMDLDDLSTNEMYNVLKSINL